MLQKLPIQQLLAFWLLGVFLLFSKNLWGQERTCATIFTENEVIFEKWLGEKIMTTQSRGDEEVYKIPVVVHIIHKGESIGEGSNITDEQIFSQIRILNEDFRKIPQTKGFNQNPVGADTRIEFALAVRNPNGEITNGIVRVQGAEDAWSITQEITLKALSYWNSEEYLNIWVCDLNGILGYATFPESDLEGLSTEKQNPLLDGIVIDYQAFGDIGTAKAPFNFGRTATHEIGHYFGLRHIWGDKDNCLGDDYCEDTPPAEKPNRTCPSNPKATCDSRRPEMFENYLDYTDDVCMNIFTQDQKKRMRTVLENSPRRKSLLSSRGLEPQIFGKYNVGIDKLENIQTNFCDNNFSPQITLRNYGKEILTEAKIQYGVNAQDTNTFFWQGNIAPLATTEITLPPFSLLAGEYTFFAKTTLPNQKPDEQESNDIRKQSIEISPQMTIPVILDFQAFDESRWKILNPDNQITWQLYDSLGQKALILKAYDYVGKNNEDFLISPSFELNNDENDVFLTFDIAYAPFKADKNSLSSTEGVKILLSENCGKTYSETLLSLNSEALASVATTDKEWFPGTAKDWRKIRIALNDWQGKTGLRLAFVGVSNFGNNIFLDNIRIEAVTRPSASKPFVLCYPNPASDIFWADIRLQNPADLSVEILDYQGKSYQKFSFTAQKNLLLPIEVKNFPKGIYYLHVKNANFEVEKKILVH